MPKRTYTDADKERARVLWETNGNATRATARDAQIPLGTVQAWIEEWKQPPPLAPREVYEAVYETIRTDKKAEVIEAAWDAAKLAFERVVELIPDAKDIQKVATAAAIAVDKAQLLSGAATARNEVDIRAVLAALPAEVRSAVVELATAEGDA
jgi:hypothetical protein